MAQKVRPVGQLFGWVWRPQTIRGARGGARMPKYGHARHFMAITWANMNIFDRTNTIRIVLLNYMFSCSLQFVFEYIMLKCVIYVQKTSKNG